MAEQFQRTEMLIGKEGLDTLSKKRVAIFGIGGVGGYVCEALVRTGVGMFDLIDGDKVEPSNLNRQLIALNSTLYRYKVDVMKERMLDINPEAKINVIKAFFSADNAGLFPFNEYDYVVDAVDTVSAKVVLVLKTGELFIPIISSMGTGNKFNAEAFKVGDIYETKHCPLAKVMRRELRKHGVKKLKVVYSEELPVRTSSPVPGSMSFVPGAAGLLMAGEVVKDLLGGWQK